MFIANGVKNNRDKKLIVNHAILFWSLWAPFLFRNKKEIKKYEGQLAVAFGHLWSCVSNAIIVRLRSTSCVYASIQRCTRDHASVVSLRPFFYNRCGYAELLVYAFLGNARRACCVNGIASPPFYFYFAWLCGAPVD